MIKSKHYIRKEGRKKKKKGIYYGLSYLINIYIEQNRIQEVVLIELSRIQWNLVEYGRI